MRISCAVLTASLLLVGPYAGHAAAMGLNELSEQNPADQNAAQDKAGGDEASGEEGAADEGAEGKEGKEAKDQGKEAGGEAGEELQLKSPASKALAGKLSLATSVGWIKATRSGGSWSSNGLSDVSVAYKILPIGKNAGVAATYRYVPINVSGTVGERSYRGVWEGHYVGGRFTTQTTSKLSLIGSGEIGGVMAHMVPVDGLPIETGVEKGGASVVLGGGADWALLKSRGFTVGPRIYAGFGSFTTFQLSASAGFMF